ncbi:putative aldehyde dehydrogenase-like protein C21C3 [Grifola frondosa]|uniref:Putative aldehyde dehydrogenase-like protein C21C3 n=1 Tax=Grifola frondosa TaxID=5627 RepID=A0A1C7MQP2_GRIFR|nr:putative aldehyde dehydrogenase-like protein C21C3 [Grifola frondosa]
MAIYEHSDQTGISFFYPLVTCFVLGFYLVYNRHQTILNRAIPFRHTPPDKIAGPFQSIKIPKPSLNAHTEYEEFQLPMHDDSKKYITAFDPATGYHLETIEADSTDDIITKIHKAAEAQKEWKKTSFVQRRRVIRSLKKWLVDNQEICAKVACRDTGKTMLDAALGEILTTCSKMDYLFHHGERVLRPESRTNPLLMFYKSSQVHYEPLGVVAAIVSWNYPLHNAWSPILAALFAGDAIVACGYSRDLVQLHITFIGSEQVGRIIAKAAAENLTPVTLELGGKDPAIILPSTDLSKWSSIWMRGVYQNSGQNCIGIERLIVHRSQTVITGPEC